MSSMVTTASPVPGDAFGGDSLGPSRVVANVIGRGLQGQRGDQECDKKQNHPSH